MTGRTQMLFSLAPRAPKASARSLVLSLIASTLLGTAGLTLASAQAQQPAATATQSFNLPAQPLQAALDAFVRQTGWQLGYASALVQGRTSRPVSGTLTPSQALQTLLAGTGVTVTLTGPSTAALTAAAPAATPAGTTVLAPVTVFDTGLRRGGVAETVIDQKELERKNPSDLRDVFAGEPGVRVGSSVPMSQKVYVNGVEETNLAVSIDGSRQNNKVFHHNGTTVIDPSFLKAVRVDAGVAPADAGPGALAGAIAYETKDAKDLLPGDGIGGQVKSSFNTNGSVFTNNVTAYGREGAFEAFGSVNYGKGGKFTAGDGKKVDGTATDVLSGLGKLAVETERGHRFEISHERVHDDAARPFRANIGFITGRPTWEPRVRDYTIDRQNTVLSYSDAKPSVWWNPTVVLAYSRTDVETPIFTRPTGSSTTPGSYPGEGATDSLNGKIENKFNVGLGSVTAGADFYKDKGSYEDQTYGVSERARNMGLYAQARLEPVDILRLSFGARGDRQKFKGTTGQEWTNSGLSYNLSGELDLVPDFLTAKAGYSHTWAGIPLAENFIMNNVWRYGAGPKPVKSDNVTAGLAAHYAGFTLEGRVFQTKLNDARAARFAVASATLANDVKSKGFEIGAGYAWADGFVRAKYADIDVTINGQPADSDTGTYLATPMGQIITVGAGHTFRDWGVTLGADLEVVLDYEKVAAGNRPLKGYEVFNAYAEYQPANLSNLTFRLDVRNLFDRTYADRATYGQEFGTVTPLYQPGRAFLISATAKF